MQSLQKQPDLKKRRIPVDANGQISLRDLHDILDELARNNLGATAIQDENGILRGFRMNISQGYRTEMFYDGEWRTAPTPAEQYRPAENAVRQPTAVSDVTGHLLLSTAHTDTVASPCAPGAIIYGNASSKWAAMAHPGAAGSMLHTTSTTAFVWTTAPRIADAGSIGFVTNGNISRAGANLLSINNSLCFQGDTTCSLYKYAAGTIGIFGRGYINSTIGIGIAPGTDRGIACYFAQSALAASYGMVIRSDVTYAGGAYSSTTYGVYATARHSAAQANTGNPGLVGFGGLVEHNVDNQTISNVYGVYALIGSTSGTPTARVFTNAYGFYTTNYLPTGSSVVNWYGFYMPNVTDGTTSTWGIYIADTSAKSYFAAQTQHAVGSAATPGIAGIGYLTTGFYWAAGPLMSVAVSGAEVLRWGAAQSLAISGSAATPSIGGISYSTTGFYWAAGPTLGFAVSGASIATMAANDVRLNHLKIVDNGSKCTLSRVA